MEFLRRVVEDPRTERVIMALIIFNAVTLGLETSQTIMAQYGEVLHVSTASSSAVFVAELAARIAVQRTASSSATAGTSSTSS